MSSAKKPLGERLIESMQQANAWARGENVPGMRVHVPEAYDVPKDARPHETQPERICGAVRIFAGFNSELGTRASNPGWSRPDVACGDCA